MLLRRFVHSHRRKLTKIPPVSPQNCENPPTPSSKRKWGYFRKFPLNAYRLWRGSGQLGTLLLLSLKSLSVEFEGLPLNNVWISSSFVSHFVSSAQLVTGYSNRAASDLYWEQTHIWETERVMRRTRESCNLIVGKEKQLGPEKGAGLETDYMARIFPGKGRNFFSGYERGNFLDSGDGIAGSGMMIFGRERESFEWLDF